MDVNFYIDRLLLYFHISTITELADKMGITQPTISKWKARDSVSAIKKKCLELGIYNDIFADIKLPEKPQPKSGYTVTLDLTPEQIAKLEETSKNTKIEIGKLVTLAILKSNFI